MKTMRLLLYLLLTQPLCSGVMVWGAEPAPVQAFQLKRVAVLGDARMRHADQVTTLVPLKDGRQLLSAAQDRCVRLWDIERGEEVRRLVHPERVWCVVTRPGEQTCISTSGKKELIEWNLMTGQKVRELTGHDKTVFRCAVSPDGSRLIAGDGGSEALEWGLADPPQIMRRFNLGGKDQAIYGTAWSADGACIALGGQQKQIALFDARTGQLLRKLDRVPKDIYTLQFSPDGTRLISASDDKTVRLWAVADGKEVWKVQLAEDVKVAAFSPDGKQVAAGMRGHVFVLSAEDGKEQCNLDTGDDIIWPVAFTADGRQVLAGGSCLISRFDVTTGKRLFPPEDYRGPCSPLKSVVVDPRSGNLLCVSETDKMVFVVDPKTGKVVRTWENEQSLSRLALSGDGTRAFGLDRKTVAAWDTVSGQLLWRKEVEGYPDGMAPSYDGSRLVLLDSNTHRILDGSDGSQIRTISEKEGRYVQDVVASPDGQLVVVSCGDGTGVFYGMPELSMLGTWNLPVKPAKPGEDQPQRVNDAEARVQYINVRSAALLPGSGVLLVVDEQNVLRQWRPRAEERQPLAEIEIRQAIAELNDESFPVRQRAIERLIGCGDEIREALDQVQVEENQELRKTLEYIRGALATRRLPNCMASQLLSFSESVNALQGHPDGIHWAFVAGYGEKSIVLGRATAEGLFEEARVVDPNLPNALAFSKDGRYLYGVNGNCTISVYALTDH